MSPSYIDCSTVFLSKYIEYQVYAIEIYMFNIKSMQKDVDEAIVYKLGSP